MTNADENIAIGENVIFQGTARELRLLEFATWRFMNDAYSNHKMSLQKRPDITDDQAKKTADAFWKDAKEAESLVHKLRELLEDK